MVSRCALDSDREHTSHGRVGHSLNAYRLSRRFNKLNFIGTKSRLVGTYKSNASIKRNVWFPKKRYIISRFGRALGVDIVSVSFLHSLFLSLSKLLASIDRGGVACVGHIAARVVFLIEGGSVRVSHDTVYSFRVSKEADVCGDCRCPR